MFGKIISVAGMLSLSLISGCCGSVTDENNAKLSLPNPEPPFAVNKAVQGVPEIGVINSMKRSSGGTGSETQRQYGVTCGANRLTIDRKGPSLCLFLNGQPRPVAHISYWGSTVCGWGHPFKGAEPEISFDPATKTIVVSKKFHAASAEALDGLFTENISLLDNGLINISYARKIPSGATVTDQGVFFSFTPFASVAGMKMLIDGERFDFSAADAPDGKRTVFKGMAKNIIFSPDKPGNNFSVEFPEKTYLEINESRLAKDKGNQFKYNAFMRIRPNSDGRLSFKLDMRKTSAESLDTADSFAKINFWKDDRLHIPDYGKCRNLAPNPSFESGLRYYGFGPWASFEQREAPVFSVDSSVAKFGNCSLKMNAFKGETWTPGTLQTFAIPTVPGNKYTVSFYAKGDKKSGLGIGLGCVSGVWLQFPKVPSFKVTDEWKRYSFTVTAPNNALTFLIRAEDRKNKSWVYGCKGAPRGVERRELFGSVWVDGLQIEEGGKVTDYVEKPLFAELLTSNPDNFLKASEKNINARLKITTSPNTVGSLTCELEDLFYQKPWKQSFDFKADDKGVAIVKLPLDKALGTGVYVLRADFKLQDGWKGSDFFRLSRMNFLNNVHKNKNIFASNIQFRKARGDDMLERYREIGIGSTNYLPGDFGMPAAKVKKFFERISRCGIDFTVASLSPMMKKFGVKENLREIEAVTPDLEKRLEEAAFQIAKEYPNVNIWDFHSEFEGCKLVRSGKFKDFAKIQIACYKGVKRFDPNKKFYLGGSCNMQPRNGTRFVDEYIKATEEVDSSIHYDGFTIHPYRTTPEAPDLDADAVYFFSILDKHGYKDAPVLWEEGIYYTYYQIPEWGLNPHRGCSSDHYRAGCPSYHMGWGERISAAYFARSWLVALKYQDRVKQFNGWSSWLCMDANLTPFALQKVPNTLGHLLGDAVFKEDIRFAPDMRCYLFEDGKSRPIAAIWSYDAQVDHGFKASPVARFKFGGQELEIIDLMGNRHPVPVDSKGFSDLPITPFPVFIRGRSGELQSLASAVRNARMLNGNKSTLQFSVKPLNASELQLSVSNLISRPFKGHLSLGKMKKEIELPPDGKVNIVVPMSAAISDKDIIAVKLPVTLLEDGSPAPIMANVAFNAFAVRKLKSGSLPDWKKIPAIPIRNRNIMKSAGGTTTVQLKEKVGYPGDFEASFQMAWDDDNLYLKVSVTDDVFVHNAKKKVGGRWFNDSLQVYIDTLCDARDKSVKGFDGNDYNYDFYPNADGSLTAFRRYAPEQQAAGGLFAPKPNMVEPEIKGSFKKTPKGYSYEIAFPKRLISPFELKAENYCGFSVYLNDMDGKYVKSALTTTPPGTGGYMNPHLYPVMLLTK